MLRNVLLTLVIHFFFTVGNAQYFFLGDDPTPHTKEKMSAILKSHPQANQLFNYGIGQIETGKFTSNLGGTAVAGGLILGVVKTFQGLDELGLSGNNSEVSLGFRIAGVMVIGGFGLSLIGNLTSACGYKKVHKALDLYNGQASRKNKETSFIEIGTTKSGVGLTYSF